MGFTNQQILEGTNDRFTVEFNDGLAMPEVELDLLANRTSDANIEVNHDKYTLYKAEYDPDMDEFDGEVNYDEGELFEVSMVGKEFARGYQAKLTELKSPVKREVHAANVRQLGGAANNTRLQQAF